MPRPPEAILARLEELIDRCKTFLPENRSEDLPSSTSVPKRELWRLMISSIQTVASACGRDSPHLRELERCRAHLVESNNLDNDTLRGVLEAARDDLRSGMLLDLRQLVTAESFGDLLETAAHLLTENHHLSAVALSGAVLESSLRALATRQNIGWSGSSGISKLNQALYGAGSYSKVTFGEIEAWGKLRNQVDHGDFASPQDVDVGAAKRMLDGVRGFVAQHS